MTPHTQGFATLLLLAGLPVAAAFGAGFQDHGAIRQAAETAAAGAHAAPGITVQATADPLDPRLRLKACPSALVAEAPGTRSGTRGTGRVTVAVSCPGATPWRLFVPVRLAMARPVVVAARTLPRDVILAPGDVRLAERDLGTLPYGYLPAVELALGQRLRRGVADGEALAPAAVAAPTLVRRGQAVTLEARGGGVRVQATGIARGDGAAGDFIEVENPASGRIVRGEVRTASLVEIRLQ